MADEGVPLIAGQLFEFVVLSVKPKTVRGRKPGSERTFTFHVEEAWPLVPGRTVTAVFEKQWTHAGRLHISGTIESAKLDVRSLGLTPLRLEERRRWDPTEHYWGDDGAPLDDWARRIVAWGPRLEYEMEQALPGAEGDDPFSDPISQSNDLKESGDRAGARRLLMQACEADLRCLDAHAHLGNLVFDRRPVEAIQNYEAGYRIGELSLGESFDGVLPWGWLDNRPFLRCMHGYGLCLWRLEEFEEAVAVFDRMLWLNPSDNQGVRFLIDDVRERLVWRNRRDW